MELTITLVGITICFGIGLAGVAIAHLDLSRRHNALVYLVSRDLDYLLEHLSYLEMELGSSQDEQWPPTEDDVEVWNPTPVFMERVLEEMEEKNVYTG